MSISNKKGTQFAYIAGLTLCVSCLAFAPAAQAADVADSFTDFDIFNKLADHGVYVTANYMGQGGSNVHGGQRPHHWAYADQITAGLTLETEKLFGLEGGWVQGVFTNRHGHSVSGRYINTFAATQALYGDGQTYRLTQLTYMQTFNNNMVNVRVGREVGVNSYFTSPTYYNFQNIGNYVFPLVIATDNNPSAFPLPSWGGRLRVHINDDWQVTTGVYQAIGEDYLWHSRHGFNWGGKHDEGVWLPFEVKYATDKTSDYPTMFALGVGYDTGNGKDMKGNKYKDRTMWWVQGEQVVYKPDPKSDRGLRLFAAGGFATSEKQVYKNMLMGGFIYKGLFAQRAEDMLAFQAYTMRRSKNNRTPITKKHPNHTVLEINYAAEVRPGLTITPDFQYIIHPDGLGQATQVKAPKNNRIKNAIYLGAQVAFDMNKFFNIKAPDVPN